MLPVCVAVRVPVELIVVVLLPEMVEKEDTVPELEGVGSFEPDADAVELLEPVEERVLVRDRVFVGVKEGVDRADPDTLDVIVCEGVFVKEDVLVAEGVVAAEGVKEGVWVLDAVVEGVSEIVLEGVLVVLMVFVEVMVGSAVLEGVEKDVAVIVWEGVVDRV